MTTTNKTTARVNAPRRAPAKRGQVRRHSAARVIVLALVALLAGVGPAAAQGRPQAEATPAATAGFSATGDMITPRQRNTATLLSDGRVLVAGGNLPNGSHLASAEIYDPLADRWQAAASMGTPRAEHLAARMADGRVLIVGGVSTGGLVSSAEVYDPATNSWSPAPSIGTLRAIPTLTLLPNGKLLLAGGSDNNVQGISTTRIYDPQTNSWSPGASMAQGRWGHTATLLADGKVLVASGDTGLGIDTPSAELYDPVTNTWSPAGNLLKARHYHTATLLPNGEVLVAGGGEFYGVGGPLESAELYSPINNSWRPTAAMGVKRVVPAAALLADGTVLVVGGTDVNGTSQPDRSAEIFDPATGNWRSAGQTVASRTWPTATALADGSILVVGGGQNIVPVTPGAERYRPPGEPPADSGLDLSISLYRNPDQLQRAAYEAIIGYFADGVFEQSNGAHKLGTVTIYTTNPGGGPTDIQWLPDCWPNAHIAGYGVRGLRVEMCDRFGGVDFLEAQEDGGYVLAHEWGHYFYGLYDEYVGGTSCPPAWPGSPCQSDVPVEGSVMHSQWNAKGGNFAWLNFSTVLNNTRNTAQHRVYRASGWETLARSPALDPPSGTLWSYPRRAAYPVLAEVAPGPGQAPRIDLVAGNGARSALRIIWADSGPLVAPAAAEPFIASVNVLNGAAVSYPEPIRVLAVLQRVHPIAGATAVGELIGPGGAAQSFTLRDDGVAPDQSADDGLYAGLADYAQDGAHTIRVSFTNPNGAAREIPGGGLLTPPPPGSNPPLPTPTPVAEPFATSAEQTVQVQGTQADDHGDTPASASALTTDNLGLAGRIDRAGDLDLLRVTAGGAGVLALRVTDLALGMEPRLRLLGADGTVLAQASGDTFDGYVLLTRQVRAGETLYIEIRHQDATANRGSYRVSSGALLTSEVAAITRVYLPLIRR